MVIAISIIIGMIFYYRTGITTGGIISPGLLAIKYFSWQLFAIAIAYSMIILLVLEVLVRVFGVYGRQRTCFALLLAAFLGIISSSSLPWIGWIVPGLMAADMQRQGILPTALGLLVVSGLSLLTGQLIYGIF